MPSNRPITFPIGLEADSDTPVYWQDNLAVNSHIVIAGGSGSGKTHQLRRIAGACASQGATIWIADIHGDIDPPGGAPAQTTAFTARSRHSLNPLRLDPDPDAGGVRNRINAFERLIDTTSHRMGPRQRPILRRLLEDLYAVRGFYPDDPASWSLQNDTRPRPQRRHPKSYPTLLDLRSFISSAHRRMKLGGDNRAMQELDNLIAARKNFDRAVLRQARTSSPDTSELEQCAQTVKEAFGNAIDAITADPNTHATEELLRFNSADAVSAVGDRIDTLEASGVFTGLPISFPDRVRIRRLNLSAIGDDEQRILIETLLEDIFRDARNRGITDRTREWIIVDEAHRYFPRNAPPDAVIPRIFREGRKFGIGILLASQQLHDMPDSVLSSAGCTIILGVAAIHQQTLSRRLALTTVRTPDGPRNPLSILQPRKTALVGLLQKGRTRPLSRLRIAG